MVKNVTLTIDHKSITVPETTTILEAARMLNINIPTLCYLKDVNEIAACRLSTIPPSCAGRRWTTPRRSSARTTSA